MLVQGLDDYRGQGNGPPARLGLWSEDDAAATGYLLRLVLNVDLRVQ